MRNALYMLLVSAHNHMAEIVKHEHVHAAHTMQSSCYTDKSGLHVTAQTVNCPS